jgi:hypothetical protein
VRIKNEIEFKTEPSEGGSILRNKINLHTKLRTGDVRLVWVILTSKIKKIINYFTFSTGCQRVKMFWGNSTNSF